MKRSYLKNPQFKKPTDHFLRNYKKKKNKNKKIKTEKATAADFTEKRKKLV